MAYFRCATGGSGAGATITVSYTSDFYGQTITCTHGIKTYSKVATSSGTLDFTVDEEGTWTISCTIGLDTYTTTADIDLSESVELTALPNGETVLPTDDIETWLACAGITDKSYTTLAEVLADSETYNALLGDSNACAYMARSTTFATTLCADQFAMSILGRYDTACDALLSNATWASAIANSDYYEYVLNTKVPTMTSNTTPSGEVIFSSEYSSASWPAWSVFKDTDGLWLGNSRGTSSDEWIGYDFGAPVIVKKFTIKHESNVTATQYKLQGSNTGNSDDWHELSTTYTDLGEKTFVVTNDGTAYSKIRVLFISESTSISGGGVPRIAHLQFYGHKVSGAKIHGATNDSFYILDGGSPVTITDPSTLSAGTYTVYSTVAKDPSNLSNDYSKTIRICPNTKEIVVMPDGIIVYWYGYNDSNIVGIKSKGFTMHTYTYVGNVSHNQNTVTDTGVTSQGSTYAGFASDKAYDVTDFSDMKVVANTQVGINNVNYSHTGVAIANTNVYEYTTAQMQPAWTTSPILATLDLSAQSLANVYFYLGLMYEATKTETLHAVWFDF